MFSALFQIVLITMPLFVIHEATGSDWFSWQALAGLVAGLALWGLGLLQGWLTAKADRETNREAC